MSGNTSPAASITPLTLTQLYAKSFDELRAMPEATLTEALKEYVSEEVDIAAVKKSASERSKCQPHKPAGKVATFHWLLYRELQDNGGIKKTEPFSDFFQSRTGLKLPNRGIVCCVVYRELVATKVMAEIEYDRAKVAHLERVSKIIGLCQKRGLETSGEKTCDHILDVVNALKGDADGISDKLDAITNAIEGNKAPEMDLAAFAATYDHASKLIPAEVNRFVVGKIVEAVLPAAPSEILKATYAAFLTLKERFGGLPELTATFDAEFSSEKAPVSIIKAPALAAPVSPPAETVPPVKPEPPTAAPVNPAIKEWVMSHYVGAFIKAKKECPETSKNRALLFAEMFAEENGGVLPATMKQFNAYVVSKTPKAATSEPVAA